MGGGGLGWGLGGEGGGRECKGKGLTVTVPFCISIFSSVGSEQGRGGEGLI